MSGFKKDIQYFKFCLYGFLKNLRFFEPFLLLIFLYVKELSYTQIGVLYSVRFIVRSLLEIPSGIMADAMGRKGTMLFSYAFYILSFAGYFYSDSFLPLIISTVLFASGDAFRTGTHKAMIFEYLKQNKMSDFKVDYYGHTRSWSQLGSALSAIIAAGLLLIENNYNNVFLYSIIPYSIGFIMLATYPRYLNGNIKRFSLKTIGIKESLDVIKISFNSMKHSSSIKLLLNVAFFSGFYLAIKDYLQIILSKSASVFKLDYDFVNVQSNREIIIIGLVYFAMYFLTAAAARNAGNLSSRFTTVRGYLNILYIVGAAGGVISGIFYREELMLIAVFLFIAVLVIQNLRRPACVAVISDSFNPKVHASVLSFESQFSSVTGALFSLLLGMLADNYGAGFGIAVISGSLIISLPLVYLRK
ncbi:MAG: MFS transporter [Bacteroidales bacterium]|nr:MFS transporter [Bacteroidales bacterium]